MFGRNTKPLPKEYLTSYLHWDHYMAGLWCALLQRLVLIECATVVEVAPGTSTKIGLALKQCGFKGALYIVEPSKDALLSISEAYHRLLPEATIYAVQRPLSTCVQGLPQHVDVILANHPLDDMLMAGSIQEGEQSELFGWTNKPSTELPPSFLKQWSLLSEQPSVLQVVMKRVAHDWNDVLEQLNPKAMIISQYPSITLDSHQLQGLNQAASAVLDDLKTSHFALQDEWIQSILSQQENFNNTYIATEILNAKNWGLFRIDKTYGK